MTESQTFLRKGLAGWTVLMSILFFIVFDTISMSGIQEQSRIVDFISGNTKHSSTNNTDESIDQPLAGEQLLLEYKVLYAGLQHYMADPSDPTDLIDELTASLLRDQPTNSNFQELWIFIIGIITIGTAAIPLGFIIHEVYYYIKWRSPISKNGLGRFVLGWKTALKEIYDKSTPETKIEIENHLGAKESETDSFYTLDNWLALSYLIEKANLEICDEYAVATRQSNFTGRSDRLHMLGSSQVGFSIGFGLYLLTKLTLAPESIKITYIILIVVALLTTLIMFSLMGVNPNESDENYLPEIFIAALLLNSWLLNPAISQGKWYNVIPVMVFGLFVSFLWIYSLQEGNLKSLEFRSWILLAFLGVSFLITILSNGGKPLEGVENIWTVIGNILIYCAINIAFTRNKRHQRIKLTILQIDVLDVYCSNLHQASKAQPARSFVGRLFYKLFGLAA